MWVDSESGREPGLGSKACRRGRQPKSVLFTFFSFSFAFCLFIPIYDDYDMMHFLLFFILWKEQGGLFGLVWVGWVKKRFGLVLDFVVLCLDWGGMEREGGVFV